MVYSPVPYIYREVIQEEIDKQTQGKVFFFDEGNTVKDVEGKVVRLAEVPGEGDFIFLEPEALVRIDRIITLFGKPGAAFDEYDDYANQCLACTGGYDI
ncbi:MAG TPA: hypothetical protein VKZ86_08500 [Cyclobacteriaceae bacterium]|nr:hypothetical protein [Cyclobacteriaceae bacterium]